MRRADPPATVMRKIPPRWLLLGALLALLPPVVHRLEPRRPAEPPAASARAPAPATERAPLPPPPPALPEPSVPPADEPEEGDDLRQWARENPEEATAWLWHSPPGPDRDTVVEIVGAEIARFDPARAVRLAETYADTNVHLLENLVHQWAEQDEAAAMTYALARPPGEPRNRFLSRLALVQAKQQPAAAARWVVAQIPSGDIQQETVLSVLQQWAPADPAAALAWVRTFPPGDLQERALRELGLVPPPVR